MIRSSLKFAILALTTALAAGCDVRAEAPRAEGSFEQTIDVSGSADVEVYSRSGNIRVQAGRSDSIHVSARMSAYGSDIWLNGYNAEEQIGRLQAHPPVEQTPGGVRIGFVDDDALLSNVTINYDITVPANTRVRATSRSGNQTIDEISGPVDSTSRSGDIRIGRVSGDVDATTRSGQIAVTGHSHGVHASSRSGNIDLEGQPSRTWVVGTRSGDVDISLAADGGAELDAQTRSGHIDADHRSVEVVESHRNKHATGVVGKGGGRVEVTTTSGSIRVR